MRSEETNEDFSCYFHQIANFYNYLLTALDYTYQTSLKPPEKSKIYRANNWIFGKCAKIARKDSDFLLVTRCRDCFL